MTWHYPPIPIPFWDFVEDWGNASDNDFLLNVLTDNGGYQAFYQDGEVLGHNLEPGELISGWMEIT